MWCPQGRLREDRLSSPVSPRRGPGIQGGGAPADAGGIPGEAAGAPARTDPARWRDVPRLAREAGFSRAGFADPRRLAAFTDRIGLLREKGWFNAETFSGMELEWILHPETWKSDRSILVCALACERKEPEDLSTPSDPHSLIAGFARRNHYAAAARMLSRALAPLAESLGTPRSRIRVFSNSRIPEKPLFVSSGLASFAANGLAVAPGLGSGFVIAGAVIPAAGLGGQGESGLADANPALLAPLDPCGSCSRCVSACPAGAIVERGLVDPARCFSALASREEPLPPEVRPAWGRRLYGCDECQRVCPLNAEILEQSKVSLGELGPSVSIARILSMDADGIRSELRGTALGMSWISPVALLRNALVAAGNSGEPLLRSLVERHAASKSALVSETARWALGRLTGRRT